jgi:hypothetical protein
MINESHIRQNTRESAVRREEFHDLLRSWVNDSFNSSVGDPESHAGPAWLWVRHGGKRYYLRSDSTRAGVARYLKMVDESAGDPVWSTVPSVREVRDRVTVGPSGEVIPGFEFFLHSATR